MRYMQVIHAEDLGVARNSYLTLLGKRGVVLPPAAHVYVETIYRPALMAQGAAWLCYVGVPQHAVA
jgi:hypothetical protein